MPQWCFFAFDARSAAMHLLTPLQQAVRTRDQTAWQKEFKKLQPVHRHASITRSGGPYGSIKPITSIEYYHGKPDLGENEVPDETSPSLRWLLQEFVEAIASHYLESKFLRPRSWIVSEVSWSRLLHSTAERLQMALFQQTVLGWPEWPEIPDPFGFLGPTSATMSTYISLEAVKELAETEQKTGLFRRLFHDSKNDPELHGLAYELISVAALVELAAIQGLALYYREDGT